MGLRKAKKAKLQKSKVPKQNILEGTNLIQKVAYRYCSQHVRKGRVCLKVTKKKIKKDSNSLRSSKYLNIEHNHYDLSFRVMLSGDFILAKDEKAFSRIKVS